MNSSKFFNILLNKNFIRFIRIKVEPHTEYELKRYPNLQYAPFQRKNKEESSWMKYNNIIYPPKQIGKDRPAEITGESNANSISTKRLYPMVKMICGLSVEDALKQLYFRYDKSARVVEELLQDMVKKAVNEKFVELPANLWIENAHVTRGMAIPRIRHAFKRVIQVGNYHCSDIRIRLREGKPPAVYHPSNTFSGYEAMDNELKRLSKRRILLGL